MKRKYLYILFYKPYGVLSQFTYGIFQESLAAFNFPKNVYSVGRLDKDSEGLLLLTNDGKFKHFLIEPRYDHPRTYAVQVEKVPDEQALNQLRTGIVIDGVKTKPAKVRILEQEPNFPLRSKPIRFRINVQTCWLEMVLTEGRNRQVRKMTAAAGHPTLRLVRTHIMFLSLGDLKPGTWRYLSETEVKKINQAVNPGS